MATETQLLLREIGWSATDLRRHTGIGANSSYDLATGRREPPDELVAWLRDIAEYLRDHPAPRVNMRHYGALRRYAQRRQEHREDSNDETV